jgi:hypothetical protein
MSYTTYTLLDRLTERRERTILQGGRCVNMRRFGNGCKHGQVFLLEIALLAFVQPWELFA